MKQEILDRNRVRRARQRIAELLEIIDPHHMFRLIWAVRGLQTNPSDKHSNEFAALPKEAVGADLGSQYWAAPWSLETILNEYLVINNGKSCGRAPAFTKKFHWDGFAELMNANKNLEEAETNIYGALKDVLREIVRIKYRQFHWQSGLIVYPILFRSHYLLRDEAIHENFRKNTGVTLDDFTKCGMAFWSQSQSHAANYITNNFESIGISNEVKELVLERISLDWKQATEMAVEMRVEDGEAAYKPSVLRKFPIIRLEGKPSRLHVPLNELLVNRITGDLFYDAVISDDHCRSVYGDRFEQYCFELASRSLPDLNWVSEITYGSKKRPQHTPDVLGLSGENASLVLECKAKRVPFKFKADIAQQDKLQEFLQELAKGQFQIWKFASAARNGAINKISNASDACGLVVTYEDWSTALPRFRETIDELTENMIAESNLNVSAADRIPVCFVSVESLEQLSMISTAETLRGAIKAYREQFEGWDLVDAWRRLFGEDVDRREFAFADDVGLAIPWLEEFWDQAEQEKV